MKLLDARRFSLVGAVALPLSVVCAATTPLTAALAQDPAPAAEPAASGADAPSAADDPVVAVVNGIQVHLSDVQERYDSMVASQPALASTPFAMVYTEFLKSAVNSELVTQAGRAAGLSDDPEVLTRLEMIRARLIGGAYLNALIEKTVTDEAIKTRYDEMKAAYTPEPEIRARHILLDSEDAAKKAIKRLKKGEDFATLAQELSTGPSGKSGGDLGFFTKDRMVGPFADAAFALKPGEISETPVKTEFGWHIIKVEEARETAFPPLDELEGDIHAELASQAVEQELDHLREGANLSFFTMDGHPMDNPLTDEGDADDTPPADPLKDETTPAAPAQGQ